MKINEEYGNSRLEIQYASCRNAPFRYFESSLYLDLHSKERTSVVSTTLLTV
jgi:hypothetical protein